MITRLNPDGSLDDSFKADINLGLELINAIAIQSDGKIVAGGGRTSLFGISLYNNNLTRLNSDGSLDLNFNPGRRVGNDYERVQDISIQQDGKILIQGTFSSINNLTRNGFARLHPDGSVDLDFDPEINSKTTAFFLQEDGKILLAKNSEGDMAYRVVRLHPDGSTDNAFQNNNGFDGQVTGIALQSDGKVITTGDFNNFGDIPRNYIARLFGGEGDQAFIESLILVNADTDKDMMPLIEGRVSSLALVGTNNLSVRAITNPNRVGSVRFELDGPISINRVENMAPYTLFGDSNRGQDYAGKTFLPGQYILTVTPFEQARGQGTAGVPLTVHFEIPPTLILVNADTNEDIMPLFGESVIDLNALTTSNLSIRMGALPPEVRSVAFNLSGPIVQNKVENITPFALYGDSPRGNFIGEVFKPGQYTIKATLYALPSAQGGVIQEVSTRFTVSVGENLSIAELVLVNADTDEEVLTLTKGAVVDLNTIGTNNLNILAKTSPEIVGSVLFLLHGPTAKNKIENVAPYAIFGDQNDGQDYLGSEFAIGQYNLAVTPYGQAAAKGTQGETTIITFEIIDTGTEGEMVNIYPNVTSNEVTIALNNIQEAELQITNSFGEIIEESMLITDGSKFSFTEQKSGTYVMIFKVGGEILTKQVIVIK